MIRRVGIAAALGVAFTLSLATVAVAASTVRVPHATLAMPFHAPYGYIVTVRAGTDVTAPGAARLTADGSVWRVRRAADVAALRAAGQLLAVEANALRALQADPLRVDQYAFTQMAVPATPPPVANRKILVIDSGIDLTHPDIALRAVGTTVAANPQEVTGLEGSGDWHGTAVFSTIGAAVDGTGGEGLFPGATIASFDASFFPIPAGCGLGGCVDSAKVIAGIDWAVANDYDIVSMSLGSSGGSAAEYLAVARAVHAGILVVAAAGNEAAEPPPNGNPLNFPAGYEHVISVGATNPDGSWAVFSNFNDWNDVAAPGLDVYAAVPAGFDFVGDVCTPLQPLVPSTQGWCKVAGTSFSTPLTSAAAAWIWSARPNLTALQVGDVLRAGARPGTGQVGAYDPKFGFGIVDITRSLDPAIAPDPPLDLNEPNDDIIMIKGGAGFGSRDAAILKSTQKSRTITAFHDFAEDPSDIYRVDVPKSKKKRWTVSLRLKHAGGDLGVCLWKSNAPTVFFDPPAAARRYLLGCSRQNGAADDTLTVKLKTNTSRIYVDVFTPTNGEFSGQYSLKVSRR